MRGDKVLQAGSEQTVEPSEVHSHVMFFVCLVLCMPTYKLDAWAAIQGE